MNTNIPLEQENKICGNCAFFTGEECDGEHEGTERYYDDGACDGFEEKE